MYVRYKKNIQENDLPRKRVRKASKIAGSGGQYLEIRYPERGRKQYGERFLDVRTVAKNLEIRYPERGRKRFVLIYLFFSLHYLEIRYPERGRKLCFIIVFKNFKKLYLEIRYPERGRKLSVYRMHGIKSMQFGNKIPREGTETKLYILLLL